MQASASPVPPTTPPGARAVLAWEPPVHLSVSLVKYLRGIADVVAIRREQVRSGVWLRFEHSSECAKMHKAGSGVLQVRHPRDSGLDDEDLVGALYSGLEMTTQSYW